MRDDCTLLSSPVPPTVQEDYVRPLLQQKLFKKEDHRIKREVLTRFLPELVPFIGSQKEPNWGAFALQMCRDLLDFLAIRLAGQ